MEQLMNEIRERLSHPIAVGGASALGKAGAFEHKAEQIALKYYVPVSTVIDIYKRQVKEEWEAQGWEE